MPVSIEYISNLSPKNNNIVIFVSSLSQLKNIDFPLNFDFYLNNKQFTDNFNSKKYITINNIRSKNDLLVNIIIFLLKPISLSSIEFGSFLYDYFHKLNENNITLFFSKNLLKYRDIISDLVFGFCLKSYSFKKYKSLPLNNDNDLKLYLYKISKFKELDYKNNLLTSINYCKDLVSEPANVLNPEKYSIKCLKLKKYGLKVKILNTVQLEKIGMYSLLGVAAGSDNEPRVVLFEWNVKKNIKPIVLVGKGVTFDTGGISLKPSLGMEEMIMDMGGSAVVVGSMLNAALNKSSKSLVGIIGLVENMPDGKAQRPGDIVKSLSGQTIEVLNTDAEGRLVLADILTYIQSKYDPKQIIDFATLTGAIMIALGTHKAGLFSNSDSLSKNLEKAGDVSGEKIWRLPLGKEYDDEINSLRADMKNIGTSKFGGSIQAAQFIQRFIKNKVPWAHIDIAGVTWSMKESQNSFSKLHSPGATAFGVRLIDQFLKGK